MNPRANTLTNEKRKRGRPKAAPSNSAPRRTSDGVPLSGEELRAWRALLEAGKRSSQSVDASMRADTGLALDDYELLAKLADAPDRRLTMGELGAALLCNSSALTYRVDRMVALGLVERVRNERDGRSVLARLTEAGTRALDSAGPTLARSLRSMIEGPLGDDDLIELGRLAERLNESLRPADDSN